MSTLYILHGWSYTTETWLPFMELLEKQGQKVVLLKVPGLTDGTNRVWTLDDYVEWLKGELAGEERVILLGHSNGGRISLAFTAKYPEKVERLILVDSAGIYPRGLVVTTKRAVFKALATVGKKLTSSEKLRSLLYRAAREGDYKQATPEMRQTMANLISVDLRPVLPQISVPTLIIWGAQDKSTPLTDGQLMHARIPHSELYVIPQARHSPQITHPVEVVERIQQTLAS